MGNIVFENQCPIILVHGLTGWGPDELIGYKYWGGLQDIEGMLNANGYDVRTAVVGPFSSNWDRTCELYAYIFGGTVDYGAAHSAAFGHARYGRTFPGIYPEWGTENQIHLFGHSMGGQTSRFLASLLIDGSREEQEYYETHREEGISPLFLGGKNWVKSISTIGTPHNGSTFADQIGMQQFIEDMIYAVAGFAGITFNEWLYDFKLDQWGLSRNAGEALIRYLMRIFGSNIWESKDTALYDLTLEGSAAINTAAGTKNSIYYFSYGGDTTYRTPLVNTCVPLPTTLPLLYVPCTTMGAYVAELPQGYQAWWPNDGLVSTISAAYPFGQPCIPATNGTTSFYKGIWSSYPIMSAWDHMQFVGVGTILYTTSQAISGFYLELAGRVMQLR